MKDKILTKLRSISCNDILKLGVLITIGIYIYVYLHGLAIWNTSEAELDQRYDISLSISSALDTLAITFIICCINFRLLFSADKIISCISTVLLSALQIIILGIPEIYTRNYNAIDVFKNCIKLFERNKGDWRIEHLERSLNSILLLERALHILIIVSLITALVVAIRNIRNIKNLLNLKTVFNLINILMIILTVVIICYCVYVNANIEDYVESYKMDKLRSFYINAISLFMDHLMMNLFIILPPIVFLTVVIGRLIQSKKYMLTVASYICYIQMFKNIIYHTYNDAFRYARIEKDYWSDVDMYLKYMYILTAIFAVAAIIKYIKTIIKYIKGRH